MRPYLSHEVSQDKTMRDNSTSSTYREAEGRASPFRTKKKTASSVPPSHGEGKLGTGSPWTAVCELGCK